MLGRHIGEGSAEDLRFTLGLRQRRAGQAEIRQHGSAVTIEKNVGRLDVAMKNALTMGMIESFGQPAADPANDLDKIARAEEFSIAQRGRLQGRRLGTQLIDGAQESAAIPEGSRRPFRGRQRWGQQSHDGIEICAGHVLHAHQPQVVSNRFREDANDVIVFQAGQGSRFVAAVGHDFQSHLPAQGDLLGQVDSAEGALTQDLHKLKIVQALSRVRQPRQSRKGGPLRLGHHGTEGRSDLRGRAFSGAGAVAK